MSADHPRIHRQAERARRGRARKWLMPRGSSRSVVRGRKTAGSSLCDDPPPQSASRRGEGRTCVAGRPNPPQVFDMNTNERCLERSAMRRTCARPSRASPAKSLGASLAADATGPSSSRCRRKPTSPSTGLTPQGQRQPAALDMQALSKAPRPAAPAPTASAASWRWTAPSAT